VTQIEQTPKTGKYGPKPNLPWSPGTAVLVVIAIYLASAIIGGAMVTAYPQLRGFSSSHRDSWLGTTIAQFWYVLAVEAITLGLLLAFVRWKKGSFKSLGLVRPKFKDPFIAVAALAVYFLLYFVLLAAATHLFKSINVNQSQQLGFNKGQHGVELALTFVSLVILPPLVEEIAVRGFLFTSLRQKLALPAAVIITSLLFASAHLEFGSGAPLLWVAAIDTFTLSLVLCYLRYKTGSLWPGISLHAFKNLIAFMALFVLHIS
jgi:membrane protease YdiL (CAAX protease family)